MKKAILFLTFVALIFGCKTEPSLDATIAKLMEQNDTNALPEIIDGLANWEGTNADLATKSSTVADFLIKNKRTAEAVALLNNNIRNNYSKEVVTSNGAVLADIYSNVLNKNTQAKLIRQSIATNFPDAGTKVDGDTPLEDQIKEIGKRIFTDETGFDKAIGQEFITAVENFALLNPTSEKAPTFLIDAATIARNLGSGGKTLELFRTVYERFPNHPKAGDALFYEAFTYDADLKDFKKAEAAYKKFMEKNPEHPFVDQAKVMLQNLGKSDEELLKSLGK